MSQVAPRMNAARDALARYGVITVGIGFIILGLARTI